jgi:peroxiredoxin
MTGLLTFLLVAALLAGAVLAQLVGEDKPSAPLGANGANATASGGDAARTRQSAPDFTLLDPDGRQTSLSDWRGRPVLLNFWATWCGRCGVEMPTIQTAFEKHQADGLMVLAIAVDDDRDDVQRFFDKYDLTFQPLLDDGTVARAYQVFGLPTSFFINADGEIVATHIGVLTARALENYLAQTVTKDE